LKRRAFTLVEMLVTITIIAIVASVVAPMFSSDDRLHVMAASSVLSSDIELAQVMTISYPQDPVIVKFDPANRKYWLAYAATPNTPITREESNEPYVVVMGEGRASTAQGTALALDSVINNTLQFNAQGGLTNFNTQPLIEMTRGDAAITLSLAPTTGTVTEITGRIADIKK
jgi:prepilin-type N-terminal cleavage/methylation domain-containing protein